MTIKIMYLVVAFTAGIGLGLFYFGGLWLTVRAFPTARRPVFLTLSSFVGRLAVALIGLYLVVMNGHWERLLIALLGFLIMRVILVRRWGKKGKISDFLRKEV